MLEIKGKNEEMIRLARVFHLANPKTPIHITFDSDAEDLKPKLLKNLIEKVKQEHKGKKIAVLLPFGSSFDVPQGVLLFDLPLLEDFYWQNQKIGVEFARLTRKTLRNVKSHTPEVIIVASVLLGMPKSRQIFSHLLKSLPCYFLEDAFIKLVEKEREYFFVKEGKGVPLLQMGGSKTIKHERVEQIWKQKIKKG